MNLKGNTEKAGSVCPICNKPEVNLDCVHEICELCGMAIDEPLSDLMYEIGEGIKYHFCCERCYSIYVNEVEKNKEIIDALKDDDNYELLSEYDDIVKDLIITYINRKYPKRTDTYKPDPANVEPLESNPESNSHD